MKNRSADFKNEIKTMGRQIRSQVTYGTTTLEEELYHINFSYDGNILKSVMKRLEVTSSTMIPKNTTIDYQLGVLIPAEDEDDTDEWEWLDYGNFIVYEVKKEEDTDNYVMTCYDKLLLSMVDYVGINDTFPMSVRSFIGALCTKLGITFANSSDTFANYNRTLDSDLYADLDYTYRDIFDELAQVTGSTICINDDDELEIRYIGSAVDTITAEFLKDVNVDFGEKYGPVNSIVLSRSAESDNVYLRDEDSVSQNGLCEIKIIDNQIMNFNDRSDYLPDLLQKLDGLEFHTNDFSSYGIAYLEVCDRYNITIGQTTYSCIMLNDEIDIEQGIEENIHTDLLEESETDYTKADKTDRRINQTYIIVDKQNQTIEALAEEVSENDEKVAQLEIDVDGLTTLVRDTVDITDEDEGTDPITMGNAMKGSLLELHIYGNNNVFDYLYPRNNLYPSDDLYPYGDSRIHIWTDNLCPDSMDDWVNGFIGSTSGQEAHDSPFNQAMILSKYIEINDDFYLSLESSDYKIWSIAYYDEDKVFISKAMVKNYETAQTIPNGTKYLRFEIVDDDFHYGDQDYENEYPEILPADIVDIKPMIKYGSEKDEYCGYNNTIVDLGVTGVLRRFVKPDETVIRDSFDLVSNHATITRRVGVDSGGNMYDLVTPVVTDLGEMIIPVAEGKNYFNIVNYNAICKVRWVILNTLTRTFASTVELESEITQLANSINLQVSKKVGNNEIIARINMAVLGIDDAEVPEDVEKSIIEIEANKISIASDNFSITKTGVATFKQGTIGNWNLNSGYLYSNHYEGSTLYQSGLSSVSTGTGTSVFMYSGCDITNGPSGVYLTDSNFYVRNDGLCKAKWFQVNGEDGYFYVDYNSGRHAMALTKTGLRQFLDNTSNNIWASYQIAYSGDVADGQAVYISDAKYFGVIDNVHGVYLAKFTRIGNNSEPSRVDFWGPSYVDGAVIQTASSDERLKENIEESQTNALDIIDDIDFYSFDWKDKNKGHIDIGFVAQRLQEQYEKLVIHSEGLDNKGQPNDTYQIDLLNTLALTMKGVQELSNKVNELEEEIRKLKGESDV